ncbi:MAG: YggS family pyridoxal phosphate-dependent enzyme [Deltaproteobacteria bacterium]|nr:YggS family pyridoxal phosphate-dependent enzyme [Myxococcales bacterium]MDP3219482.1 YggS family pyridoxal phosphate-dependent enzyme [Deltaproteobacteria bacterium]
MTASGEGVGAALDAVRARIAAAAARAGRDPAAVTLVAVSKTHGPDAVRAAYARGQRDFGENYVQELVAKAAELADLADLRWHFIGHLQTNKCRDVAGRVAMVQSLDSVRLVRELGRRAVAASRTVGILVQVNVAREAQKSGCEVGELGSILAEAEATPGVALRGLMTVPPAVPDAAASRPWFEALRALRDEHGGASRLPELSMGMTHDMAEAVAAGATMVRVGTAIFGAR